MMIDADACALAIEKLASADFYFGPSGLIFDVCRDLYAAGKATDITVVASELKRLNRLDEIDGSATLMQMIDIISTTAHVGHHIEVVKNYSILRELSMACMRIEKDCFAHTEEPRAILEKAEKFIYAISEK